MADEITEAAERRRKHLANTVTDATYAASPYFSPRGWLDQIDDDAYTLADAYLALVTADDAEPADGPWLETMGFSGRDGMYTKELGNESYLLQAAPGQPWIYRQPMKLDTDDECTAYVPCPTNRREVRRLIEALGAKP